MDSEAKSTNIIRYTTQAPLAPVEATIYERMGDPMLAVEKLGKWFAASGLLGVRTPEQGAVVALTCMLEKITPLEFCRTYDIIEGKPSKKAAAMQAEFQRRGGRIEWLESTSEKCTAKGWHPELCPKSWTITRTLKELEDSGVATCWDKEGKRRKLKDNYQRSAAQMLRARVVAELVRMIDPSINAGLYSPEEIDDDKPEAPLPPSWAQAQPATPEEPDRDAATEDTPQHENAAQARRQAPPSTPQSRAAAVLKAFRPHGVVQPDLEALAGRARAAEEVIFDLPLGPQLPEDAEPCPLESWEERDFGVFTAAKNEIAHAALDRRGEVVRAIFALPASAVEG